MTSPKKPPAHVVEACFPARELPGLPVRDLGMTNVTHAETRDSLRLPRPGDHQASLVAVVKHYDGTSGGRAGFYLALWGEVRYGGQRWKTPTLKVRAEEAARVAKDMLACRASTPRRDEAPRYAGRAGLTTDSVLLGVPVAKDGYLLFVRSAGGAGGGYVRSRGVEILSSETGIVSAMLEKVVEP